MCGAISPLPQYAFTARCSVKSTGTTLHLHLPLPPPFPRYQIVASCGQAVMEGSVISTDINLLNPESTISGDRK